MWMFFWSTQSDWETKGPLFPLYTEFIFMFPASQEDAKHDISKSQHFRSQSISDKPRTSPILGIAEGNPDMNKAAAAITAALPLSK